MAVEMVASEMPKQLLVVKVADFTVLTEGMSLVGRVVGVALPPVHGQLRPRVAPPLMRVEL